MRSQTPAPSLGLKVLTMSQSQPSSSSSKMTAPVVIIENICFRTTRDRLKEAFEKRAVRPGDIILAHVETTNNNYHLGWGYMFFRSHIAAMQGLMMDGQMVDGRKLRVLHPTSHHARYATWSKAIDESVQHYTLF